MSIEPDPFDRLAKLLALKKYEKPPPRYFQEFSERVIARLEAAEQTAPRSWWEWLGFFQLKPAFAGVAGLLCTAGLVSGMLFFGKPGVSANSSGPGFQANAFELVQGESSPGVASPNLRPEEIPASTAPVASALPAATPFSHLANVQLVSWR